MRDWMTQRVMNDRARHWMIVRTHRTILRVALHDLALCIGRSCYVRSSHNLCRIRM
jgi:hypothetical protein